MSPEPPHKQPWERQEGEPSRPYSCFCIWRDMGPERDFVEAVGLYLTLAPSSRAGVRVRQQAKYQTHPDPIRYQRNLAAGWRRWAQGWRWQERADAYDAWNEVLLAQRTKAEREAAEEAEAETLRKWKARKLQAHVGAQEFAIQVFSRALELARQGQISSLPWHSRKQVEGTAGEGGFTKSEVKTDGIAELLPLALRVLVEGQTMEQKDRGEPTEHRKVEVEAATEKLTRLVKGLGRLVSPEKWGELEQLLDEIDAEAGTNGHV